MNNSYQNTLYHYTTIYNALKILSDQVFKFGHLLNTNDPHEQLQNRLILNNSLLKEYFDGLCGFYNSEISIACFGTFDNKVIPDEKWTMWSHYGGRHSGACLVFDKKKLINEIRKKTKDYKLSKMKYKLNKLYLNSNDQILGIPFKKLIKDFNSFLLFTKHKDWKYENEFRIVVFCRDFEIPIHECLKRVVLAPETDLSYENICKSLLKIHFKNKIESGRLAYHGSGYLRPFNFYPE